jgi:hypothetical protein
MNPNDLELHASRRLREESRFSNLKLARWLPLAGLWLSLSVVFAAVVFVVERAAGQAAPGLTISQISQGGFELD